MSVPSCSSASSAASASPAASDVGCDSHKRALSLRAKLLLKLERWFPPQVDVPVEDSENSDYEYAKAAGTYGKYAAQIGGLTGKTVLDFGCGWGGETAWLAQRAAFADGCDINDQALLAAEKFAQQHQLPNITFTRCTDHALPYPDNRFDAVFSQCVFEHVMEYETMLREIHRVLKPGGSFISKFGPLFYSPFGYHMLWAVKVPWAHHLFGFKAMIQVRNLKRHAIHPANWRETGLNMMTYGQFARAAQRVGFEAVRLRRMASGKCRPLAHLPVIGDWFTFGVDCHLRKR